MNRARSLLLAGALLFCFAVGSRAATKSPSVLLPNRCALVASVAAAELQRTGAWTRIIIIRFYHPRAREILQHALVVWHPPTAQQICVYDETGTWDLGIDRRDPEALGYAIAKRMGVILLSAHFI